VSCSIHRSVSPDKKPMTKRPLQKRGRFCFSELFMKATTTDVLTQVPTSRPTRSASQSRILMVRTGKFFPDTGSSLFVILEGRGFVSAPPRPEGVLRSF
jgi:hypothetical protein